MNTSSEEKSKSPLGIALAFGLPFLFCGAAGFLSSFMDTRGFDKPDIASCWLYFLLFGVLGGIIGLGARAIFKGWRIKN